MAFNAQVTFNDAVTRNEASTNSVLHGEVCGSDLC